MLEGKATGPPPVIGRLEHSAPTKSLNTADSRTADSAKQEVMGLLRGKGDPEPMIFRKKGFKVMLSDYYKGFWER